MADGRSHREGAAVHLDDTPRDGEAEPGPALRPRRGVVDLLEFLEDARLVLGRDFRACVADVDLEKSLPPPARRSPRSRSP